MVGWHHCLDGHEFEQTPGVGDGQGSLACCNPWGRRVRQQWQPTPVFLPGESQGRGSLVGYRLWGSTESDTTEATQQQQQRIKNNEVGNHIVFGCHQWLRELLAINMSTKCWPMNKNSPVYNCQRLLSTIVYFNLRLLGNHLLKSEFNFKAIVRIL